MRPHSGLPRVAEGAKMTVMIRIPTPLRPMTEGRHEVEVEGSNVREVLSGLFVNHRGLRERLLDEKGEVRRYVNLFLNKEDIRHLDGLQTKVERGDVLSIVPAIAGGSPTVQEVLREIRGRVVEVTPAEVEAMRNGGDPVVLLDVRDREELEEGTLPGAVHLPKSFIELRVEQQVPDRETPIITYCAGGQRSLLAADGLARLGYRRVRSMAGGFGRWRDEGLPVARPRLLTPADRKRYLRHLSIPEVGEEGQVRLLESKVLLIGAGGLGCPGAFYLAAAGVGTLGVVDFDVVDETNLQRQILHTSDRVGTSKTESARKTLLALNPGVTVNPIEARLSSDNVESILSGYDVIVDGSDNFPTRYLVNDACVLLRKPCVHGSVYRFEGQVTVFRPPEGPCYRCLYPEPPPPELAPSCADAGMLGVLPGVIGLMEAVEAIKLVLGIGRPLIGRLLLYDALTAEFHEMRIRRDPNCSYCGDGKEFPGFVDYESFCARPRA